MFLIKTIFKPTCSILAFTILFSVFCMGGIASSEKSAPTATNDAAYHKYFDLEANQIADLSRHGYTDEQIAKLDKNDFESIQGTWKLSIDSQKYAVSIYPQLKNTDISSWTNSEFMAYAEKQDDLFYAPTKEQKQELEKRGIPLNLARRMLKGYCTYDNLLAQTDDTLAYMIKTYNEADEKYGAFEQQKNSIRNEYLKSSQQ